METVDKRYKHHKQDSYSELYLQHPKLHVLKWGLDE